ncbi:SGNH/GDSL hydrolase family protein [Sinomonas sp. JGH33]|uniref:SGNH/GDSL hydrolase family protein n=1 Tax=Sinomonas terricola TaxID=3110330 RepID=A0ABU5T161_9MICC|nr:SGNH/GDSL hydrolase family protein [Sinomonas sp. JGH33]MEA5453397.1 SGNH/GDSL hydrolase family protein [Sinomonas sp. JGH33]
MKSRRTGRRGLLTRLLGAALVGAALLGVVVTGWLAFSHEAAPAPPRSPSSAAPVHSYKADRSVTVAVYGDSISQGDSRGFAYLDLGKTSWVSHLQPGRVRFVGGQAIGGTRSGDLPDRYQEGVRSNVLVLFLGTNDFRTREASVERMAANFAAFYAARGASMGTPRVITVALGPMADRDAAQIREWNRRLEAESAARGWTYADPWTRLRDSANRWLPAYARDEVHPNEAGAVVLAEELSTIIERAAG